MTDTEQKRKPRKHQPHWNDSTITARSTDRRAQLRSILNAAGWKSESELHTAIINGIIKVPPKPQE